jgi:hypothetical protein
LLFAVTVGWPLKDDGCHVEIRFPQTSVQGLDPTSNRLLALLFPVRENQLALRLFDQLRKSQIQ